MELPKSFAELNRDRKASGLEEANEDQSPDVRTAGLTMQKASSQVRLIIPTTNIESDKQAEIQDLTRLDKNRRTVLHRAALDQNVALVTQLCERAERVRIKEQLGEYVDSVDKFGNTPLLTACVVNHNSKKNRRLKRECLQELIKRGAYPNTTNHTTLWTPLMWCSFYGDTEAIQLLLDYKAFAYLCDKDGLFPLDHCGLQDKDGNRKDAAEALIKNLMELIRKFDENENSLYPEYTGYERYIKSPLLRTSIAYWAIYFKLEDAYITELIGTEGVYPDLPLKTISGRNCYHACAYQGNGEVLKMLLERERYQRFYKKFLKKKRALGYGTSKAAIEKDETERMFGFTVLELKNKTYSEDFIQYTKDSVKWVMKFEKVVAKIVNEDGVAPRHFEAQDSFGNTPLHVASFLGKTELVKMLLEQGANIQIENKDGWRCQELRQYPEIEDLYKQYVHQSQKKEIAGELVKNTVGVHLHIMPLAHAALVDKKSGKLFGFKNLFRKYKVADTVKAQSKKIQNELNEQSSLCNEQRLIPDVVLVFQADPLSDSKQSNAAINRINFNISLIKGKFTGSYLASNINNTLFYLMIKMDKNELEKECASNAIKIKLLNSYNHQVYDINRKVDFEPFRSRQRQEITLASLNKLIDIQQLKDMGVLKDVYTMHTVSGINRIREAWINTRWYWPEPLASMKDYFREGKHLNFTAITTLRMYFGEKVAFYFAWTCFYTNFLFLLAVPGLAVYIALEVDPSLVPLLLPIWVTYNSLCSTLVVERWKRKSSEIATRWGTIDMVNDTSRKRTVRTEFIGDETVHESTGILTKINVTSRTTFYFLVSLPILLVLLAAVVASFFGTQYIQINYDLNYLIRMLISAVNGFLLSIINIVYSRIARYFVDKENHKYSDTYENSLIFKVFIFQFLNSYLGLFYVIFYQGFSVYNVQFLMISLLVSKQVSSLASACIIPWLLYKFKKTNYFKSLKTKAKADDKERERRRQTSIDPKAETKKDLAVVRSVLNCHTGNPETDNWDLTRVELSSMRKRNDEFVDEYGQMFTQCGYVTMFAPAFPIGPAISLVANIIDIRAKLFALLHIHHRPPVEKAGDIGYWQTIWEVISIIGIFFNAVILFFNTDTTIGFIEDNIMDYVPSSSAVHDIRRLWAFLILVHLLLIIKLLVIALIKDKPAWVLKEEKKQIHEERQALQNQKALATASVILDAQKDGNTSRDNINQKGSGKSGSIKEVHATSKTGSLPLNSVALELNHGIKTILYNTYTHIEKDLVMKRLGHLANLVQEVVIKCDVCKKNKALLECLNCSERYCDKCLVDVHNKTAKSTHKIIYLDKSYTAAANQAIKGAALDVVPLIRDFPTRDEELSETLAVKSELDWQKVEAFSFPTIGTGDPYHSVEKAYKLLHRIYIEENGISAENIITNIERALKVKKSLDAEGNSSATKTTEKGLSSEVKKKTHQPDQGGELSSGLEAKKDLGLGRQCDFGEVDYSWLDEVKRYFEMGKFNLEEKLWMNRIAFMVFKKRGGKTTYGDFYRQLKILENSQFEAKVILLFDLLDEDSDGIITLNDLLKVMSMSFLQNVKTRNCHEDLMKAAFSGTATIDKKGFLEKLLNNSQAKMVMKAYLQVRSLDGKA